MSAQGVIDQRVAGSPERPAHSGHGFGTMPVFLAAISTILGAVIGAAIMAVIRNAFVLLKLPIYTQTVAIGVVIILAVAMDQLRKRGS